MNLSDLPATEAPLVLHGPPMSPQMAARLLVGEIMKGKKWKPEALHTYNDADGYPIYWRPRARLENGDKLIRPMSRRGIGYELKEPDFGGTAKPLYRLHELMMADPAAPVFFVEGEKKADDLAKRGLIATTAGSCSSDDSADLSPLAGRRVYCWPDNDKPGREHMQRVAEKLLALGGRVEIIEIDLLGLPVHGDASDYLIAHPNATAADLMALQRVPATEAPKVVIAQDDVATRCLADIEPQLIQWLWPGRIARGKVTLVAGNPGLGKSQLSASLAAIVSRGGRWPVDRAPCEQGSVLLLNAEDDVADTIRPRLDAAGADVTRVHILDAVRETDSAGQATLRLFSLAADLDRLDRLLGQFLDVALVVIDPISAYLGGTDSHNNADVRALLAPLSAIAGRHGVAIVLISHLNKGNGTSEAMMRVTGSLAFVGAARAAYLVVKDQDDETRRLFLPMKNNTGPDREGLAFCVESVTLPSGIEAPRLVWESDPVTVTADEAMRTELPEHRSATDEAMDFLRELLAGGPMNAKDVKSQASQVGIEEKPLRRAREKVGVKVERQGFGADMKSFWMLAVMPNSPVVPSSACQARMGTNEEKGTNEADGAETF